MIKKILLTALVIFLAWLFLRWRQKKTAEVARTEAVIEVDTKPKTGIYYLAGSVITLMIVSIFLWIYFSLD